MSNVNEVFKTVFWLGVGSIFLFSMFDSEPDSSDDGKTAAAGTPAQSVSAAASDLAGGFSLTAAQAGTTGTENTESASEDLSEPWGTDWTIPPDIAEHDYIGHVIVDPSGGALATPACPDVDRYFGFQRALEERDEVRTQFYMDQHDCVLLYEHSNGEILEASRQSWLFKIKVTYHHHEVHTEPLTVYADAMDLRDMNGRKGGYLVALWDALNGYD